jgi:hypothetical protein
MEGLRTIIKYLWQDHHYPDRSLNPRLFTYREMFLPLRRGCIGIKTRLTLILLAWRIGLAPSNARKWQMEINSVF